MVGATDRGAVDGEGGEYVWICIFELAEAFSWKQFLITFALLRDSPKRASALCGVTIVWP